MSRTPELPASAMLLVQVAEDCILDAGTWHPMMDQDRAATDHGIRVIANTIALHAWRNGPIENVHAGRYVGYGLNERRVLPKAEKSIKR